MHETIIQLGWYGIITILPTDAANNISPVNREECNQVFGFTLPATNPPINEDRHQKLSIIAKQLFGSWEMKFFKASLSW